MKTKEKIGSFFNRLFNHKPIGIILNQPIESETKDWIGVSSYVDNLADAIDGGAKMIAVTSDFGSGKSSLISMYKKRYASNTLSIHWRPKYVYTINMWEALRENTTRDKTSVIDLHKSFLFHLINQLSSTKGSYISKRLSKNYGLFSLESSSILKNVFLVIMVLTFVIGEILRRFGEEVGNLLAFENNYIQIFMFAAYVVGVVCALIVLFRSDFIFSSSKSEGNREIDENVLIDYYNHEVYYKKFFRHYILVIEDLDRIDDLNLVKGFLKEIHKYYLTDTNLRSWFHHNQITFIINIKPEPMLRNADIIEHISQQDQDNSVVDNKPTEKLYTKYFDYIINLKKINIDNYDTILIGLMKELKDELYRLKLLTEGDEILIENIAGMQWIIRGNKLDIREIKNRFNSALSLYKNLISKFNKQSITFEKCAVATYLIAEYECDFYKLKDRDIETVVEKYISGNLEEDTNTWGGDWEYISDGFKSELYRLVVNKIIDSNYRTYFYNYPKGSKLYDLSASIVFNSIIYNERPKNIDEFEKHLGNTEERIIHDAYHKVEQLNVSFPRFIVEFEKLFVIAANHFRPEILDVIEHLQFDSPNVSRTSELLGKIVTYKNHINERGNLLISISELLDKVVDDKEILNGLRQTICKVVPEDALSFKRLFFGDNAFITTNEINSIQKVEVILQLVNNLTMDNSLDECKLIHQLIMKHPENQEAQLSFYIQLALTFEIEDVFNYIRDYCIGIDQLPDELGNLLVDEVSEKNLDDSMYIDLLCSLTEIDEYALNSIIDIGWRGGLPLRICEKLREQGEFFAYVCNMLGENEDELDLESQEILDAVLTNAALIYEDSESALLQIRRLVLKNEELISDYLPLYGTGFAKVTEEELNLISNYKNVILILQEQGITEEDALLVAEYFNKKYRNPTESFNILQYLAGLDRKIAEVLFYELDMKRITYKAMSARRKNIINAKLISLFELEKDAKAKIEFMQHIGMSVFQLEKDLYKEFNEDNGLYEVYLTYANSLEKVESATIKNLINSKKYGVYSKKVNEKLFEMRYFKQYVSSKTAKMKKFEIEEDRKNILWTTYKEMFHSPQYGRTTKYMVHNERFLELLLQEKAYLDAGNQLVEYSAAKQNAELINYVVSTMDEDDLCSYFSKIKGFNSHEAAQCYVDIVVKNNILLGNEDVYINTYDKLIDPGLKAKYTRARNKFLNSDRRIPPPPPRISPYPAPRIGQQAVMTASAAVHIPFRDEETV